MAGLERGRSWQLTWLRHESEWRAANGEVALEPLVSWGLPWKHGSWRLVSLGGGQTVVASSQEMGGGLRQVWAMGGPRRVGGPSTGDLGWAESLAWSAVQAWGRSRRLAPGPQGGASWILQRTTLNLWAWTLRPFSERC